MIKDFRPGVLSTYQILELVKQKIITGVNRSDSTKAKLKNESAIDLHLSNSFYEMNGGIKGREDEVYISTIKKFCIGESHPLRSSGEVLKLRKTYIVPLREKIWLQNSNPMFGVATGKSSIGRLDILTRLVADYSDCYDQLPNPQHDIFKTPIEINLYIEITPLSFPVYIYPGIALNQLRLIRGKVELSRIPVEQLTLYGRDIVVNSSGGIQKEITDSLSINLESTEIGGGKRAFAFRAKSEKEFGLPPEKMIIDLNPKNKHMVNPADFWMPVDDQKDNTFTIEPESFYIIRSLQRFKLPSDVAVYAQAMTETLGELRIHYAGFVHPCFGYIRDGGAPLIFEIRGHNVPTLLRHEEAMARLQFYRMSERAENDPSYGEQELTLSNYFKPWA
jgi:dCTP deaminase